MVAKYLVGFVLLLVSAFPQAKGPLVTADWLRANLGNENLLVLDLQPKAIYRQYHVPGSINSNYGDWRRADARKTPKMIPPIEALEQLIGGLGIDNDTHVVLVVTGRSAGELASATRVYWTFKVLGHDAVSILDGGLIAYAESRRNPLESKVNPASEKSFKANLRKSYLTTAEELEKLLYSDISLVDNRSGAEYVGLVSGGGKERPGTIPGALNLPYDWLTVNGGARFHTSDNLQRILQNQGVPTEGSQIYFCHTGHRASLAWFVSHELLGNHSSRLYDGSTAEWSVDASLPMERKIQLR